MAPVGQKKSIQSRHFLEEMRQPYKVGPNQKWSEMTPLNGLLNGQLGLFHPYK